MWGFQVVHRNPADNGLFASGNNPRVIAISLLALITSQKADLGELGQCCCEILTFTSTSIDGMHVVSVCPNTSGKVRPSLNFECVGHDSDHVSRSIGVNGIRREL